MRWKAYFRGESAQAKSESECPTGTNTLSATYRNRDVPEVMAPLELEVSRRQPQQEAISGASTAVE